MTHVGRAVSFVALVAGLVACGDAFQGAPDGTSGSGARPASSANSGGASVNGSGGAGGTTAGTGGATAGTGGMTGGCGADTDCAANEACDTTTKTCGCIAGFADCNQNATDGCEVDTGADAKHCGACATACASTELCSNGQCQPAAVTAVEVGGNHSCSLFAKGGVKCWGANAAGQLGLGDKLARGDGTNEMGDKLPTVALGAGVNAVKLSLGDAHTCAVLEDGALKCWGAGGQGRLGLGDTANRGDGKDEMAGKLPTVDVGKGKKVQSVACGAAHTCALLEDGLLKCWGAGGQGRLGLGEAANRGDGKDEMGDKLPFVDLGARAKSVAVAVGAQHTCALLEGGRVKCWGANTLGQLGLGDTAHRGDGKDEMGDKLPAVDLGSNVVAKALAVGASHACVLLDDGAVKCWGANAQGQLGLGDKLARGDGPNEMGAMLPPVNLGTGAKAVAIAAGETHSCAKLDTGELKCWGANLDGRLGLGDKLDRGDEAADMGDALKPVNLSSNQKVTQYAVGGLHSCARLDSGSVKCWGVNALGQLGLGDKLTRGDEAADMGDALPAVLLVGP